MTQGALRPTAFRGDTDAAELRRFFGSERQFDGDARWTFGTSLKSAYVNCFEFLNLAPVVQLWRDQDDNVQAVSRISSGTGEWFHQAAPGFRDAATAALIIDHADAALDLLTDLPRWGTVAYESDVAGIERLVGRRYEPGGRDEVFMTLPLVDVADTLQGSGSATIRLLDADNPRELRQRARAQVHAFSDGNPSDSERAWIDRTLPHQLEYETAQSTNLVAMHHRGVCMAFADFYVDETNLIGEFEPVGTRPEVQRGGLAKGLLRRGLIAMKAAGMTTAIVRTGCDNEAAIAAYRSVGFEIVDHRIRLHRERENR